MSISQRIAVSRKPYYDKLIEHYAHLKDVHMEDTDKKPALPVHLILGASEYTKIKTPEAQ